MSDESKPKTHKADLLRLNLKVKSQDAEEVFFTLRRTTQFRKLMNAYTKRRAVGAGAFVFLFDGHRLSADQTPGEWGMEEGDVIDAMLHQEGGGCDDV